MMRMVCVEEALLLIYAINGKPDIIIQAYIKRAVTLIKVEFEGAKV